MAINSVFSAVESNVIDDNTQATECLIRSYFHRIYIFLCLTLESILILSFIQLSSVFIQFVPIC